MVELKALSIKTKKESLLCHLHDLGSIYPTYRSDAGQTVPLVGLQFIGFEPHLQSLAHPTGIDSIPP
jgi:hypothetical protein